MLETIFQWIASVIGGLLDDLIKAIFCLLTMDLDALAADFPFFVTGYKMFQTIAIGIVLMIGVMNLIKFFTGSLSEVNETPIQVLIRSAIAGALIFFGGNFLVLIVDLCRIPFEGMVGANAYSDVSIGGFSNLVDNFNGVKAVAGGTEMVLFEASPSVMLCAVIIIMLLIGINILKLMLEIFERYVMIGVLAYACPLFFATLSSKNTSITFKKWIEMFIGQCVLMVISAWMLKLILSGFAWSADDMINSGSWLFQLVLILAMCKIAQRADTYMQQLGIGVGTTGGNLLDDAMGLAFTMSKGFSGLRPGGAEGGASKDATLGAGSDGNLAKQKGLFGGIHDFAKKVTDPYVKKREQFKPYAKGKQAVSSAASFGKRLATNAANAVKKTPAYQTARSGLKAAHDFMFYSGEAGNTAAAAAAAEGQRKAQVFRRGSFARNGDGSIKKNGNDVPVLDTAATSAGISVGEVKVRDQNIPVLRSSDTENLANFVADHANESGLDPSTSQLLEETVRNSPDFTAEGAESVLVEDGLELSGCDDVCDALIQKAVDMKELTGFEPDEGTFTEVTATGSGEHRIVSGNFSGDGGKTQQRMELHFFDPKTYTPEKSQGMKEYKTNSGKTYYAKSTEVKKENFDTSSK